MRLDDMIVAINGDPLGFRDDAEALLTLGKIRPGDKVVLKIIREGRSQEITVIAGTMSDERYERWKTNLELALADRAKGKRR